VTALTALLCGCTLGPAATGQHPHAAATPATASSKPSPKTSAAGRALSGVLATGTFVTPSGQQIGQFVIKADASGITGTATDFHSPVAGQLLLLPTPYRLGASCPADSLAVATSPFTPAQTWSTEVDFPTGPYMSDPTYLRSVVLVSNGSTPTANPNGCLNPPIAAAELDWKIAPLYPRLRPADRGAIAGAGGTVTTSAGQPSTYTVAVFDTVEAITARFDITTAELDYLNPTHPPFTDANLQYGAVLNLDPANRGIPIP